MPTDEELRAYAANLPTIYRDILAAFPGAAPNRRWGDALTPETIEEFLLEHFPDHRPDDVFDGLTRLVDRRFLDRNQKIYFSPTPLGERLIAVITGRTPRANTIPDLPVPTWG